MRVPPFIAIRIELRSADSQSYGLDFGGRRLRTTTATALTVAGLRPGAELVGRPFGASDNGVTIEASAEPGP